MTQFFEWIFRFCLLEIHLFVYPLLCQSLDNRSTALESCTTGLRDREGEGKRVTALNNINKIMFQHINNDIFRPQFMVCSCQSDGFKYTTQTHTVICNYTAMRCEVKRAKVQRFKVHNRLICFLYGKAITQSRGISYLKYDTDNLQYVINLRGNSHNCKSLGRCPEEFIASVTGVPVYPELH